MHLIARTVVVRESSINDGASGNRPTDTSTDTLVKESKQSRADRNLYVRGFRVNLAIGVHPLGVSGYYLVAFYVIGVNVFIFNVLSLHGSR